MMSILTFHAVTDRDWFENLISWLRSRCRFVPIESVAAYYANGGCSGKLCHITVDDGDKSFADVIFPVLRKHGVHSSLFVSPRSAVVGGNFWFQEIGGCDEGVLRYIAARVLKVPVQLLSGHSPEVILKTMPLSQIDKVIDGYRESTNGRSKASQNLSASAIQELASTGLVSIGAHTKNHPILANEDYTTCETEIAGSVRDLSSLLGRRVEYFAYPNGIPGMDFGDREERFLRDSGISLAFSTESRHLSKRDRALRIPRLAISNRETMPHIMAKMLLGTNWDRAKRIAGVSEYVQRGRLIRTLNGFRHMDAS
jgi:peptidoglycan/xylan/chitin deacetylase (PgdA/CDA1 family)